MKSKFFIACKTKLNVTVYPIRARNNSTIYFRLKLKGLTFLIKSQLLDQQPASNSRQAENLIPKREWVGERCVRKL